MYKLSVALFCFHLLIEVASWSIISRLSVHIRSSTGSFKAKFPRLSLSLSSDLRPDSDKPLTSSLQMYISELGKNESVEEINMKKEALELMDCLTCPRDETDPNYDVDKDIRRDELLLQNDYQALKVLFLL